MSDERKYNLGWTEGGTGISTPFTFLHSTVLLVCADKLKPSMI